MCRHKNEISNLSSLLNKIKPANKNTQRNYKTLENF